MTFYALLALPPLVLAAAWLAVVLRRGGRQEAENARMREVIDDVRKAQAVRGRLGSDPAYARRVRRFFTRA